MTVINNNSVVRKLNNKDMVYDRSLLAYWEKNCRRRTKRQTTGGIRHNFMDFEFGTHCTPNLTWSHYRLIMRLSDKNAIKYYLTEASENNWSVRTLDRNISTLYYQRLLSSQNKDIVIAEMKEKTADFQDKLEFIKNPAVLEFLGLPNNSGYIEAELEKAIIDHIQQFLLELGKGFAFVSRQQIIKTETAEFYIDLVFYNFILKCFVLIELKTNKITHRKMNL